MKNILTFLVSLLAVTGWCANPDYAAFRGTNGILVWSNVATGKIIIGPIAPGPTFADLVWTNNAAGNIHAVNPAAFLLLGTTTEDNFYSLFSSQVASNFVTSRFNVDPEGSGSRIGFYIDVNKGIAGSSTPYLGQFLISLEADNFVAASNAASAMYYNQGSYSLVGDCYPPDWTSEGIGVFGVGEGATHLQIGVAGFTDAGYNGGTLVGQTNVGVMGSPGRNGTSTIAVGGYFEIGQGYSTPSEPLFIPSCLLLDNRSSGFPLLIGRTNNGTFHSFAFYGDHTTNATPLDVAQQLGLYSGTNYINFSATNTPPVDTATIVKWVTVTVQGSIYRMPLYQ